MGLINDPEMCSVCNTRNCQTPSHLTASAQLEEAVLQQAGARPKGLSRLFG